MVIDKDLWQQVKNLLYQRKRDISALLIEL